MLLLPLMENTVLLPGSVVFSWNGETYFDRDGSVYKKISTETNAGVQVGKIDYSGGAVSLASYPESGLIRRLRRTSCQKSRELIFERFVQNNHQENNQPTIRYSWNKGINDK
ncbi:hypothetical protein [Endozoicomonas sp.]|uniref:hypothetical protein n=1 Tax=Endozoicomonas sp. TaxID=1892382 RepID=UPI0028870DA2|nr:hypothetical protein [Endozoicomonas sp.]